MKHDLPQPLASSLQPLLQALLLIVLGLASPQANAQGAAPGLFNVREIVVQYANFANPKGADSCALVREELAAAIFKILKDSSVPVILASEAKPPMMGIARVNLVTDISTIDNQGLDCTSWVSMTAQTQSNAVIQPIETSRSFTAVYWKQGLLLGSGQATHARLVTETLQNMAKKFAQQYRVDQPPELPSGN